MTGAVPNTCHQTLVDKLEPKIFQALEALKSEGVIREYQPERAGRKGTKCPRLVLRPHQRTGWGGFALELWAFLCEGKRRITIVLNEGVSMDQLKQALEKHLGKTCLDIVVKGHKNSEEITLIDQEKTSAINAIQDVSTSPTQEMEQNEMDQDFPFNGSSADVQSGHDEHDSNQTDLLVPDPDGSHWAFCELIYEGVVRVRELEAKIAQLKADTIDFLNSNIPEA